MTLPTHTPRVIGINGRAQHGKDTIAKILHDLYGYERIAFADVLKAVAHDSKARIPFVANFGRDTVVRDVGEYVDEVGWEFAKETQAVREFLQGLGVAARQHIHDNVWVDAAFHNAPNALLAVSDMRFPNEFQAVKHRGGITIRVVRPGVPNVNEHISETALDGHVFDYTVINNSSQAALADQIIEVVEDYRYNSRMQPFNGFANSAHNKGVRA